MLSTANHLTFDAWVELAHSDPAEFELQRSRVLQQAIERARRPEQRQRLQGLQWRIDKIRECSKTPMAACVRMYDMMWDSVLGDNGMLDILNRLHEDRPVAARLSKKAPVIPIHRNK
jgi:hypothetical protein